MGPKCMRRPVFCVEVTNILRSDKFPCILLNFVHKLYTENNLRSHGNSWIDLAENLNGDRYNIVLISE